MAAFCKDILRSRLYDSTTTDADEYAELFNEEVCRVLDVHAPLRSSRRRRGEHDIRQLSDNAKHAKQLRRRLERQYHRTGSEANQRAYRSACLTACASIQRSHADHIKEELDAVSGDMKSTWRVAQSLLHTGLKTVYNDADSKKLATTFSQFFTRKSARYAPT